MAKHCTACGRTLPDGARFCAACGAAQSDSPTFGASDVTSASPTAVSAVPAGSPTEAGAHRDATPATTTPGAPAPSRHPAPWKTIVPIVALLLVATAGAAFAWFYTNPTAPDLTGMSPEQVRAVVEDAGFASGTTGYDPASTEPTWTVIAQNPKRGDRARRGSRIDLTLAGAPPTEVPALVGLARTDAESAVASATLTVGAVTESYDATVPAGVVVSQDPEEGAALPEGSPVALVVSKGPEPVGVPDVVGKSQADAEAALAAAGFTVTPSTKDDKAPKGSVLSQTPAGGSTAVPGTTVVIVVSTGVELVKVPSWLSFNDDSPMTDEEYEQYGLGKAMERLEAAIKRGFSRAGLKAVVEWSPEYWKDSYQTPKAGTMVPRGSTVRIFITVAD